jgi:hypothetical protein
MDNPSPPKKVKAHKEYKKQPFLEAFARIGTDVGAAAAVGISRYAVMDWKKNDPDFKAAYEKSNTEFTDRLKTIIHDKALDGDLGACIFLLRSRLPREYTERYRHEVEFPQIEQIIGAFSSILKQNVPPERWETVSAQLQAVASRFRTGNILTGQEEVPSLS